MSRIGRTMYFHRRLLPIFKMCRSVSKKSQFVSNKNIRPWKVLEGFLFTHCKASKNPLRFCCSHSLVFFFFYALQLVKCVEFSWDNLCFINWVDKINWPPSYTPPPTLHHSFFRNLSPLYINAQKENIQRNLRVTELIINTFSKETIMSMVVVLLLSLQ